MGRLEGAIFDTPIPAIDERLKGKLILATTTLIPEMIGKLMEQSFWAVAEQLQEEGKLKNISKVYCIITPDGDFTIKRAEKRLAYYISNIVVYPVRIWLNERYEDILVLTCIIEELCHCFWGIDDEVAVNYKVLEVMKRIKADVVMSDLYNLNWMEEHK